MAVMKILQLLLELHVLVNSFLFPSKTNHDFSTFTRNSFPPNFTFGTAAASYQYEGAYNKDGRGLSVWDTYTHQHPERITDGGNGDVAVDHYHRYKEDVQLMKEMGMDAYRFSISWSRLLPNGKLSGGVNKKGIQFYNDLINEILSQGLQPYVTIFHWDVPQDLENEYGGFLSSRIVPDFQDYAELCYREFGDRVKYWITLNEPFSVSYHAYGIGDYAPGRCSEFIRNCTGGNSATEPYIVTHNQLLAHAAAVKIYKQKYQVEQKGKIGITLVSYWMEAFSQAKNDKDAARRALDFMFGWHMDPLTYGDYPKSMRSLVGDRLPQFSARESKMLKGSYDFIGLNYYTSRYVADVPFNNDIPPSFTTDSLTNITYEKNGIPIGQPSTCNWLYVYPKGFKNLLLYIKETYNNPILYITENGLGENINNSTLEEVLSDNTRIDYYNQHLKFLLKAINEGVDVRGYFAWSLLDNFEWNDGYTIRFGIIYVDYKTMKRHPKHSSFWFKKFLRG